MFPFKKKLKENHNTFKQFDYSKGDVSLIRVDATTHGYLIHSWMARIRFIKYDDSDPENKKIAYQKESYKVQWKNVQRDFKKTFALPQLAPKLAYATAILLAALLRDSKLPFEFGVIGAIAVDTVTTGLGGNTGQTITIAHTASGSNRLLLASWGGRSDGDDPTTGSITYDGGAMTDQTIQTSLDLWQCIKSKIAPATTSKNIVFTYSDAYALNQWDNGAVAGVISFTGVDQTTPTSGGANANGTGTAASVTITSATGKLVFASCVHKSGLTGTITCGDTERWNLVNAGLGLGHQAASTQVGETSTVMDYTISASVLWLATGLSINADVTDLSINTSDSVSVAENIASNTINIINVFDSISVAESVSFEFVYGVSVFDSITVTENININLINNINVFDAITITESTTELIPFLFASVSDTVTTTENISTELINNISVFDSITVSESISVLLPFLGISVYETISISEFISLIEETLWRNRTQQTAVWANRTQPSSSWTNRTQPNSIWTDRPQPPQGGDW